MHKQLMSRKPEQSGDDGGCVCVCVGGMSISSDSFGRVGFRVFTCEKVMTVEFESWGGGKPTAGTSKRKEGRRDRVAFVDHHTDATVNRTSRG